MAKRLKIVRTYRTEELVDPLHYRAMTIDEIVKLEKGQTFYDLYEDLLDGGTEVKIETTIEEVEVDE